MNGAETNAQKPVSKKRNPAIIAAMIAGLLVIIAFLLVRVWLNNQIVSIKAEYHGPTQAGTVLDRSNTGIQVTGRTRKRNTVEIPSGEWTVDQAQTLSPDTTSAVSIQYKGKDCELRVACTDSQVASIAASYEGSREAGSVIDQTTEGFCVTATLRNGQVIDITDTCVIGNDSVTLENNKTSTVQISYTDPFNNKVFSASLNVACTTKTVKQITAKYIGEALEGEILDSNNQNFIVTAVYDNGSVEQIQGWEIRNPSIVTISKSSPVTISYGGQETTVVVECSDYDANVYRKNCSRYPYTDLVRYPENYIGFMICVRGQINQVYRGTTTSSRCSYRIRVGYRKYINVAFQGTLDNGQLIEGDSVTCYGTFLGIDENDNGYPLISAKIIDR